MRVMKIGGGLAFVMAMALGAGAGGCSSPPSLSRVDAAREVGRARCVHSLRCGTDPGPLEDCVYAAELFLCAGDDACRGSVADPERVRECALAQAEAPCSARLLPAECFRALDPAEPRGGE